MVNQALKENKATRKDSIKTKFQEFLNNGEPPFNYEKGLINHHRERIESILRGENPPPYEFEIQPSSICNANCLHCFARDFEKLENKLTTKEKADRIIDQISNFNQNEFSMESIKFCGTTGEPLMNPLTNYMVDKFYEMGKKEIRLFTNGLKLAQNKNNQDFINSLGKLFRLYISLDAGTTQTLWNVKPGARKRKIILEDILECAEKIKENSTNNTEILVNYVITNKNYFDIVEATKKIKKYRLGLIRFRIDMTDRSVSKKHGETILQLLNLAKACENDDFKVIPIHSKKDMQATKEEHFSLKGKGRCYISTYWGCMSSNGNLYPCGHIVSPDTPSYGNLFEKDFKEIWNSEKRKNIMKKLPGEKCHMCSPFSLRANKFMGFLSKIDPSQREKLLEEYS